MELSIYLQGEEPKLTILFPVKKKLTYKHKTNSIESDTTSNYMVLAMKWDSLM